MVSQHALRQTPPPSVNKITDMSKNITLATTLLWPVTRMHSSGMRTACLLTISKVGGVSQHALGGGCLPRVGGVWQTPPPVDTQTPVKNYLRKLRLRRVKICFRSPKRVSRSSKYLYSVAGLFTCRDGFAIPYDYVCNGIGDCGDGSDEDPQFAGCQGN